MPPPTCPLPLPLPAPAPAPAERAAGNSIIAAMVAATRGPHSAVLRAAPALGRAPANGQGEEVKGGDCDLPYVCDLRSGDRTYTRRIPAAVEFLCAYYARTQYLLYSS